MTTSVRLSHFVCIMDDHTPTLPGPPQSNPRKKAKLRAVWSSSEGIVNVRPNCWPFGSSTSWFQNRFFFLCRTFASETVTSTFRRISNSPSVILAWKA